MIVPRSRSRLADVSGSSRPLVSSAPLVRSSRPLLSSEWVRGIFSAHWRLERASVLSRVPHLGVYGLRYDLKRFHQIFFCPTILSFLAPDNSAADFPTRVFGPRPTLEKRKHWGPTRSCRVEYASRGWSPVKNL